MADDYWLYEYRSAGPRRAHTAMVHRGGCRHCRDGQARPGHGAGRGAWHGPYATVAAAHAAARDLDGTAWECRVCRPGAPS